MNLLELISKRRSIRQFTSDDIEQEKLDYVMECVRLAPSAANFQPWKFLIVKTKEKRTLLQKCYAAKWFMAAPVYIVAIGDSKQSWKRNYDGKDHYDVDVAIALEHLVLAATEQELGTCWVCDFDAALCSQLLQLPQNEVPVAIIAVGHPARTLDKVVNRKSIQEISSTI